MPGLYVGSAKARDDTTFLISCNIGTIIDLTGKHGTTEGEDVGGCMMYGFTISDASLGRIEPQVIKTMANVFTRALTRCKPILIHCHAGMHRAPTFAAILCLLVGVRYKHSKYRMSLCEMIRRIVWIQRRRGLKFVGSLPALWWASLDEVEQLWSSQTRPGATQSIQVQRLVSKSRQHKIIIAYKNWTEAGVGMGDMNVHDKHMLYDAKFYDPKEGWGFNSRRRPTTTGTSTGPQYSENFFKDTLPEQFECTSGWESGQ